VEVLNQMSTVAAIGAHDVELTQRIGVVDLHNDLALAIAKRRYDGIYDSLATYWLPRLRSGGVGVVVAPIYISDVYLPDGALRQAFQVIDGLYQEIDANADQIEQAYSVADIERINAAGRIAIVLSFEGAEPLGQDLSGLRLFHRLGLRMLSFTWMRRTAFADGTWENETRGGLSRLGRAAVHEMNRLGILVDVSHASDRSTLDIIETSTAPVIASHSNARALCDHPRNLTDEMIRGIAASGGVMGIVAVSRFVSAEPATLASWGAHAEYFAEVAGVEHVAVGADFAHHLYEIGATQTIAEWRPEELTAATQPFAAMLGPDDLPALTGELRRRGFSDADLRLVLRDNALRVMRDVWGA
jgi:membrane dipeptidase